MSTPTQVVDLFDSTNSPQTSLDDTSYGGYRSAGAYTVIDTSNTTTGTGWCHSWGIGHATWAGGGILGGHEFKYDSADQKWKDVGSQNPVYITSRASTATASFASTTEAADNEYVDFWEISGYQLFTIISPYYSSGPSVTDLEWDTHVDGGIVWHGTFLTSDPVSNTDLTISNEAGTLASSDVFVQAAQFANNAGGYDPGYRFRIVPNGTTMYMCEVGTEFAWGHVVDTTHNPTPLSNASIPIPATTSITASTDDGSGNVTQLVLTETERNAQNVVWTAPSGHLFNALEFWLTTTLSDNVNHSAYTVGTPVAELRIFQQNATGTARLGQVTVFVLGAQTTMTHTWQPYLPSLESITMSCTDWNPLNTNNNNNNSSSRRRRGHCFW